MQPPSKVLLEGYKAPLESANEEYPRFNPVRRLKFLHKESSLMDISAQSIAPTKLDAAES